MPIGLLDAQDVRRFRDAALAASRPVGDEVVTDAVRIDLIAEAEMLKSALCALQAELSVDLDASVRSRDARQGVAPERRGRGVAAQIALARQESPHRGQQLLGFAKDLATDLVCTHQALREGRLTEYRATIVARETGCLGREDRAIFDEDLCGTDLIDGLGNAALGAMVRKRVERADPAAVVRRNRKAEQDRRVTIRPAPDTMVYLTALLPVGQLMADLLLERLTGQSTANQVGINLDLIISDETLLGAGHEPVTLPALPGATIPAQIARELIAKALSAETTNWIRTLYADPAGRLVAMTSKQRFAPTGLIDYLTVRDQGICRTPWCDAPARQIDHITPAAAGGKTTAENLQGLCKACNLTKQADGWIQHLINDHTHRHTVETTTPTGHRHRSTAPIPPRPARRDQRQPAAITTELYRPAFSIDYAA